MAIARLRQPIVTVPPETSTAAKTAAASDDTASANPLWIVAAAVGIALVAWFAYQLSKKVDSAFTAATPASGLNTFTLFYVAAQVIERFLEPFSNYLPPTKDATKRRDTTLADYINDPSGSKADESRPPKTIPNAKALANAQKELTERRATRTIILWAAATILGMLAAACFRLYFLHAVGITSIGRAPELVATGLIIGSGTKPLHDLISWIQTTKTSAADPPEVSP